MKQFHGIRAHVDGTYRNESFMGRDYIVVPVTALVEGVIQGMTAEAPELALAEEFGRFPASWNGRPVVMSHPVDNGSPISANQSPDVATNYQVGIIFNTVLANKQLKQEAWLEVARLEALNDDSRAILEALKAKLPIEVSTAYYSQIEESEGVYNNKAYKAIQRNNVPDHLALLPEGTLGACSNADGCGINNNQLKVSGGLFRINCADCGSTCPDSGDLAEGAQPPVVLRAQTENSMDGKGKKKKKQQDPKTFSAFAQALQDKAPEALAAFGAVRSVLANSIAGGMFTCDAEELVRDALRSVQGYTYVIGITTEKVVYEQYNQFSGYYSTYQRSYSVGSDGKVTLGNDVQEVDLVTQILPVVATNPLNNADGSPKANKEPVMTTASEKTPEVIAQEAEAAKNQTKTHKMSSEQGELEVVLNADGSPKAFAFTPKKPAEQPKAQNLSELLANAEPALKETIESSVKLHAARKDALVAQIVDTKRCGFSKEALSAMSIDMLENLAKLGGVELNYGGQALPISANAEDNDAPPPAPQCFEAAVEEDKAAA